MNTIPQIFKIARGYLGNLGLSVQLQFAMLILHEQTVA